MISDPIVEHFADLGTLSEALAEACSATSLGASSFALVTEDALCLAAYGQDESGCRFEPTTALPMSCVSRPFVGALAAALIHEGRIGLDDEIGQHLDFGSAAAQDYFRGITIRHLLSQTDGLGYRSLESVPRNPAGFIDLGTLTGIITSDQRQFAPGRYYSSSQCGFGLIGALIEKYFGRPFGQTLREEILNHLTGSNRDCAATTAYAEYDVVCPATGKGLALSATELTQFLRLQLDPPSLDIPLFRGVRDFSLLFRKEVSYPGWSAGMTGACLSWKQYSDGWIGQNGTGDGQTIILRLHPERRIALAFLARANLPTAYAALGRLLGGHMQEFNPTDRPRLLTDKERCNLPLERYIGTFGNKTRRIEVSRGSRDLLEITVTQSSGGRSVVLGTGTLRPATHEIFFIPPPNVFGVWFIQYLAREETDARDMIWDGWFIWPRLPDCMQGETQYPVSRPS